MNTKPTRAAPLDDCTDQHIAETVHLAHRLSDRRWHLLHPHSEHARAAYELSDRSLVELRADPARGGGWLIRLAPSDGRNKR